MQDSGAIKADLRDFLSSQRISVMGISSVHPLPGVPEHVDPCGLLRGAKSIICYGLPIPKGIVLADTSDLHLYWRYCNMAYRSLDTTSNRICVILETGDASAVPIYGCFPWRLADNKFWGLLPLVYWAEQAGLGRLVKCGLLAHPSYGTRILLGGVVTTLDLEPTEKRIEDPCPTDCFECIRVCPVGAIDRTGKVDHNSCLRFSSSSPLMSHLVRDPEIKKTFSFETLLNTVAVDDHGSYQCFKCIKACPLALSGPRSPTASNCNQ